MKVNELHKTVKQMKPGEIREFTYRDIAEVASVDTGKRSSDITPVDVIVFVQKIEDEWDIDFTLDRSQMVYVARKRRFPRSNLEPLKNIFTGAFVTVGVMCALLVAGFVAWLLSHWP